MKITIEYSDKVEEISSVAQEIIDNAIKSAKYKVFELDQDARERDWATKVREGREVIDRLSVELKIEREAGEKLRIALKMAEEELKAYKNSAARQNSYIRKFAEFLDEKYNADGMYQEEYRRFAFL